MSQPAALVVLESDLVARPEKGVNAYLVTSRQGPGKWLQVLPDGTISSSDDESAYQVCYRVGDKVFWVASGSGGQYYPTGCYGLPIAATL